MTLKERIQTLSLLGDRLVDFDDPDVNSAIELAHHENQWFIPENSRKAITAIKENFLDKKNLEAWSSQYNIDTKHSKNVGLVMAGNIPLVGFHDLLSVFVSGHKAVVKTSSKDNVLIKMVISLMTQINSQVSQLISTTDRLTDYDAVIATGSNNTAQHFEYYFRNYPRIIRKNRASIAILNGEESQESLEKMGNDVFDYFGLGCRNISKIFIPQDFNKENIFNAFYKFRDIINHNKYNNNYAYNEAIWLMGQDQFLTNDFIILKEEKSLHSRIASLYYEYYDNKSEVISRILNQKDDIQCISSNMAIENLETIPLGQCQAPSLSDYADHVDTLQFLTNLT